MAVDVQRVAAGRRAHEALIDAVIDLQRNDPLAPVTVIAPTSRSAIHLRRIVARGVAARTDRSGIANVGFVVIRRFCDEIAGSALRSEGRRPLSRIVLEAACRTALINRRAEGGPLSRAAPTVSELADRYEELRGVGPSGIAALGQRATLAGELALLVTATRSALVVSHFDDVDLYERAAAMIHRGAVPVGPMIAFGPERILPTVRAVFDATATRQPTVVLLVETGDAVADAVVDGDLGLPSPVPFGDRITEVVFATDAAGEVDEAARHIRRAVELGAEPERLGVVYSRRMPYAELIGAALDRAGVPWSGPSATPLSGALGVRLVSSLLAVTGDTVARDALVELCSVMSSRPAKAGVFPTGSFDRVTRRIGLTAAPLREWVARLGSDFLPDPGGDGREALAAPYRSARWRRDAAVAPALRRQVRAIERSTEALKGATSWVDAVAVVRETLVGVLGTEDERCTWPGRAGEAERLLLAIFDELATLDLHEAYEGVGHLANVIESAVDRDAPQHGRLGMGVVVGPLEHAIGLELDAIVIVGCAEGDLPGRAPSSPLLTLADREIAGLEDRTATALSVRDRRRFLLALASGSHVLATAPLADRRTGRERIVSRFLEGAPPARPALCSPLAPADLLVDELARVRGALDPELLATFPGIVAANHRIAVRNGAGCNEFDGDAPGSVEFASTAPTTVESIAICPFRFFAGQVLRAEVVDEPERRRTIAPTDRGSAMHAVLESYGRRRIEGTLPSDDPGRSGELKSIARTVFAELERFGRTGKSVLWEIEQRRMLDQLEQERQRDEASLLGTGAETIAVEYEFGLGEIAGPAVTVLGRTIEFRGVIDRIDRHPDGALDVIDYKTGSVRSYRGGRDDPIGHGRHLQLPVYAMAARDRFGGGDVHATYRFVGPEPEEIAFRLDETGAAAFADALEVLVEVVDTSQYPYRPKDDKTDLCRRCDFDRLCPSDRSDRWEVVRVTPQFERYRALVEPEPSVVEIDADGD